MSVSTIDKAVSPVNLYGATKLCMEKLFVAAPTAAQLRSLRDVLRSWLRALR